jgi:hypothetical protein
MRPAEPGSDVGGELAEGGADASEGRLVSGDRVVSAAQVSE